MVPFKPTGNKPIYCSECFEHQPGGKSGRRDSRKQDYGEKRMYSATCDDCGSRCELPFRPTSGKPIFCDSCFRGTSKKGSGKRHDTGGETKQVQEQIDAMNKKLDRIIRTLDSLIVYEEEPKKERSADKTASRKKEVERTTKKKGKKTAKKKTKAKKATSAKKEVKTKKPAKKKAKKTETKKTKTKKTTSTKK